ncbi:MAG: pre-peptidase C-terminal domain-containing protein [Burkholderiales bacterium]|nr:pre-peptidase C-terminal domain-containing protein [Burkholderiales bacterium]
MKKIAKQPLFNFTQARKLSLISACILTASYASAQNNVNAVRHELGNVAAVIKGLEAQHANPKASFLRSQNIAGSQQTNDLETEISDYHHKDGKISVSGKARGNSNSSFYLKGSDQSLRGYLIKHDQKKAYEYSTDDKGVVSVVEVPISKVVPDLDEQWLKATTVNNLLAAVHPVYSSMALRQAPHIGPYNNEDVTKLESKPGSAWVFYLNHSAVMSGSTPLNGVTKENMYRAWQVVADQYSMYNINITTNPAVYNAAKSANILRTGIINFVNQDGRSNAPLSAFGTTSAGTLYRNPASGFDYGYGIGMTAAHEVGHEMGMSHDHGGSGGEYFEGIAAYQWGPIMGNYWMGASWAQSRWTWSKGEYNTATNFEDDLKIMNVNESIPYVTDDNPSGKNLNISSAGDINPSNNFGQIERTGDTDAFNFTVTGNGKLDLKIDPIEYFGMLDVDAKIYNSSNALVASSNKAVNRSAEFIGLNLPAGSYRLVIAGGAEGTPQNGFSNYSSLGYYAMKGTLVGATPPQDVVLSSGVPLAGQSGATGTWNYYAIDVPAGKTSVVFSINGANGDADLFSQLTAKPSTSAYKCKSDGPTSIESCTVSNPAAGRYFLGVYSYSTYSSLTVKATVN